MSAMGGQRTLGFTLPNHRQQTRDHHSDGNKRG